MSAQRATRIAVLVLAAVLAVAFAVAILRRPAQSPVHLGGLPVALRTALAPTEPQFGDTVVATVDAFIDARRVDPGAVSLNTRFGLYAVTSSTRSVRKTSGITIVHVVDRLDCLAPDCLGRGDPAHFRFPRVRATYPGGTSSVAWPTLRVHARVQQLDLLHPILRVDPAVAHPSYRLPPGATGWTLLAVALALALGGLALIGRTALAALPLGRRSRATPLEQVLHELANANGDIGRRRSALERLAVELEPLDEPLSAESRLLAWAPQEPAPDTVSDLCRRVLAAVRR